MRYFTLFLTVIFLGACSSIPLQKTGEQNNLKFISYVGWKILSIKNSTISPEPLISITFNILSNVKTSETDNVLLTVDNLDNPGHWVGKVMQKESSFQSKGRYSYLAENLTKVVNGKSIVWGGRYRVSLSVNGEEESVDVNCHLPNSMDFLESNSFVSNQDMDIPNRKMVRPLNFPEIVFRSIDFSKQEIKLSFRVKGIQPEFAKLLFYDGNSNFIGSVENIGNRKIGQFNNGKMWIFPNSSFEDCNLTITHDVMNFSEGHRFSEIKSFIIDLFDGNQYVKSNPGNFDYETVNFSNFEGQ